MSVSNHGVAGCTGACRNANIGRRRSGLTAVDASSDPRWPHVRGSAGWRGPSPELTNSA